MTDDAVEETRTERKETREIIFKCKYCGRTLPFSEMKTLTRFFPTVIACRDCAEKME
ncbi:MAG: hypothetical protein PHI12_10085 [Dehalococcoidales bacterium]|nr:hypothetical protein [Dehalococcoidales bacterium]